MSSLFFQTVQICLNAYQGPLKDLTGALPPLLPDDIIVGQLSRREHLLMTLAMAKVQEHDELISKICGINIQDIPTNVTTVENLILERITPEQSDDLRYIIRERIIMMSTLGKIIKPKIIAVYGYEFDVCLRGNGKIVRIKEGIMPDEMFDFKIKQQNTAPIRKTL